MRLTVGGRYGVDNRVGEGPYFDASGVGSRYDFSGTYRRFDYKVGLEYDIAPRAMVYAALQTGFGIISAPRRSTATSRCARPVTIARSEEHTSELQSLMRISYAVFCLKKKKQR